MIKKIGMNKPYISGLFVPEGWLIEGPLPFAPGEKSEQRRYLWHPPPELQLELLFPSYKSAKECWSRHGQLAVAPPKPYLGQNTSKSWSAWKYRLEKYRGEQRGSKRKSTEDLEEQPSSKKRKPENKKTVNKDTEKEKQRKYDVLLCHICGDGAHEDKILLCDKCDEGFHMYCLSPPLETIPQGDWFCSTCTSATIEDFDLSDWETFTNMAEMEELDRTQNSKSLE
eukprot:TRINITY_DN26086_c0_g1_i1.p1 TRINITY_DN26086_c0_g1~~TRINITY_DN26086_c0_g1_i1.p1  ORF type:complete len:226 (-),score=17.52 TRINITY_DN26086_c0_g1_i1:47-724(-)